MEYYVVSRVTAFLESLIGVAYLAIPITFFKPHTKHNKSWSINMIRVFTLSIKTNNLIRTININNKFKKIRLWHRM